ncbi:HNH endonuclease [Bacteroides sp. 519]|uniref:HNH endonuclease n=1 Tax=Bacteroides sp. 519 TaxID=2302937 RepID=UPI0013D202DF|nr:HNH endonuclease [Bacteroides sp. 519]NDV56597.1 hypothetical protein [Bacteroides sp. 519]
MIRIRKSESVPHIKANYNTDEICNLIHIDQDEKCYLCERKLGTDYEIEHLKSQKNFSDLVREWSNLFLSCSYCNGRKTNIYDNIINPVENNLENIIVHIDEPISNRVHFTTTNQDESIKHTISLLQRLFNGKGNLRNLRETKFYDEYRRKMNIFQSYIDKFLTGIEVEKHRDLIITELDIKSEYLGFKYSIIIGHERLVNEFSSYIIWNKK